MEKIDKKVSKDPEVVEKATRRRFTSEYKQRIAVEAQQCNRAGQLGALLRRGKAYIYRRYYVGVGNFRRVH